MKIMQAAALGLALALVVLLAATSASAQWSAEPGATVRNAFGPQAGGQVNDCRGACGAGCPKTCEKTVAFECQGDGQLRRVVNYDCGTHQGCRVHDDCLDNCLQTSPPGSDCAQRCDQQVMETYGIESAGSWAIGRGPYDGRINFEYTLEAPGAPEPAYACPDGASRQCGDTASCVAANGKRVEPVFASYRGTGGNTMRVSAFRSGLACGEQVCTQTVDIQVTGTETCPGGNCTRFGMEFDYQGADPSAPLECTPSTSGGEADFIGDLLKQGADAMASRNGGFTTGQSQGGDTAAGGEAGDGMAQLMGLFGQVLTSADSPDDVNISMAPLDENGNPIESQRVGSQPRDGLPPIPRSIDLPSASGHLFVPMYQLASASPPGTVKERMIRCTHKGAPVLETVFRLHPG